MSFKFEVIEPKLYSGAAADEVTASILDVLSERDRCSIALAGGSTPVSIYRALTVSPRVGSIPWDKLDLLFGDERWVPSTDTQSNARMVYENLTARINGSKPRVWQLDTALDTPQQAATSYEASIVEIINNSQPAAQSVINAPQIDLVLLGMGDDGHTASIFPGSALISQPIESQSLISVEDWPNQEGQYRITMTPRLLMAAKKILFLVKGANKAEMIARAFNKREPNILPVHLFRAVSDRVTWLLDSEAAKLINH